MFNGGAASDPMPMGMAIFLGVLLVIAGVLLVEVGRRSRSGTLTRNWLVGIRTNATLESDENWEAAHRAGGALLMIGAAGPILGGIAVLFGPSNGIGAVVILGSLVWMVAFVVAAGVKGQSAAKRVDRAS